MKKISLLFSMLFIASLYIKVYAQTSQAPIYKTAAGLSVDFGTGNVLVGPEAKRYFDAHNAFQTALLFGNGSTAISTFYTYNGGIKNANGLNYYIGFGPALQFTSSKSEYEPSQTFFFIRPTAGLDYKISETPIDLTFDWRPTFQVTNGTQFTPARFGIGLRFCF